MLDSTAVPYSVAKKVDFQMWSLIRQWRWVGVSAKPVRSN